MDSEERLRAGLERNAASFDPDIAVALQRTQRRRNAIPRQPLLGIAAAALIAVLTLVALAQRRPESSSTASSSAATNPPAANVTRRFEATISPTSDADGGDLTGRWYIRFDPDGTVALDSAQQAQRSVTAPAATLSGHELIIGQFGPGLCSEHPPGRYHWSVAPWGDLDLAMIDDGCPARIELLTGPGRLWAASTPTAPPTTAP